VNTLRQVGSVAGLSWLDLSTRPLRRLASLSPREASFQRRGFAVADPSKRRALESVGEAFIGGYNQALLADGVDRLRHHIGTVAPLLRGFAVEGATMGFAIGDALSLRGSGFAGHVRQFDREFSYLTHVGAGWALARVPWRRARILAPLDPVHRWLACDGLGFHDTYFHHRRVLAGWRRRQASGYAARAYDQGVGRALWFVAGGSVEHAGALIAGFTAVRRRDLWAGLGLAMAYAGPADADETAAAVAAAGAHSPHFAQGVAFASEARALAGFIPPHTEQVAWAVSGAGANELSDLVRRVRANLPWGNGDEVPYELWRQGVAAELSRIRERQP